MSKKPSVSHNEWMIEELCRDPKFAAEYLKQSMADMSEPDGRGAALLALRRLAETHGGMAAVAMGAGIQRESLYRALSPNVAQRQPHHEYLDRRPEISRRAPDGGARQESGLTYLAPGTR